MRIRSLVVLTHARQGLPPGSLLSHILPYWRAEGRTITVHQGLRPPPRADACLLHVDLTRVPDDYLALMEDFPIRLNERTADISRRRVSGNLVARDDAYDGPVIVKTNLNYYGRPEAYLRSRTEVAAAWLAERLPARWTRRLPGGQYFVLPDKAAVPPWIWRAPGLVVERFFGARGGVRNRVELWYFLGKRGVVSPIAGNSEVLRSGHNAEDLPLEETVTEAAHARRAALGFDYGKFDVIEASDGAHVIDANRTPYGEDVMFPDDYEICRRLAPGLDDFAE